MENDGFQVVRGKRAMKRPNIRRVVNHDVLTSDSTFSVAMLESVMARISDCRMEIERSEFLTKFKEQTLQLLKPQVIHKSTMQQTKDTNLEKNCRIDVSKLIHQRASGSTECQQVAAEELVCYGIGSLVSSAIARYQFTLLTVLRQDLQLSPSRCCVYDPVLSEADIQILTSHDLQVLKINEEGKRVVSRPTLFYMPHCGKALYNNLLWSNWSPDRLQYLAIIGNSFSHIETSTPRRFLEEEGHYILKILPFIIETRIENSFHHTDVFNDLSLHIVDMGKLRSIDKSFWAVCPEPVYDNGASDIIMMNK